MKTGIPLFRCSLAIVLLGFLPGALWAQTSRGRITGVVKDPTGAVIPNLIVTSSQIGTTVAMSHVLPMPIQNPNVFSLVNVTPAGFFPSATSPANDMFANIVLNGLRAQAVARMIDGVGVNRGGAATQNILVSAPADSLEEYRVEVNNLSAEAGRHGGGVVNAVTRSGTNQFHGSFDEFVRNMALDANGSGNDTKPPLPRNMFAATEDAIRNRQGSAVTNNVGLPAGDFSTPTRDAGGRGVLVPIYEPETETGTGTFAAPRSTLPLPGNIIPVSRLDPVAVKAVSYLPAPNRTPDNPYNFAGNWQLNVAPTVARDYHTTRLDHSISKQENL